MNLPEVPSLLNSMAAFSGLILHPSSTLLSSAPYTHIKLSVKQHFSHPLKVCILLLTTINPNLDVYKT